jgi:H+-translocating diphosphatase
MVDFGGVSAIVLVGVAIGLVTAAVFTWMTHSTSDEYDRQAGSNAPDAALIGHGHGSINESKGEKARVMDPKEISALIKEGAIAFLTTEYKYMGVFVVFFSILLLILLGNLTTWSQGGMAMFAFIVGAVTSILCGYIGMMVATNANSRVACEAVKGYKFAFNTAFRAGAVMGFALTSIGILVLYILIAIFKAKFSGAYSDPEATKNMYESLAAYGLGGSSIALFGRVGGGIYTKAADVGADLVGKVEQDLNEDDPSNPATIADNVGDNVGDIAGMGADLFGSLAESTCAALVIGSQSAGLYNNEVALMFPLTISTIGIVVGVVSSFFSTNFFPPTEESQIEPRLKLQLIVSTVLMTPCVFGLTQGLLPSSFVIDVIGVPTLVTNWKIGICVICGLWSGLIIGYITEYYTSNTYQPVLDLADSCRTGAATNVIYGLALGYKSTIVPVACLAGTIYISFKLAGMFGIAMAALGILSTLSTGLTIDGYGPISDNAGGIAEMAGMGDHIRERTDALDAAGNTTAAIGKGFAIGSAAFVSLALFGAFVTSTCAKTNSCTAGVNILEPFVFAGLLVGAMLPYWFSALTMRSVGQAAKDMVNEVRRQFKDPKVRSKEIAPDYTACVMISTNAALREMIAPGALVLLTPLIAGYFFSPRALSGVLTGALISGVQIALSASNTGGAWDNAKKYIGSGKLVQQNDDGSVITEKDEKTGQNIPVYFLKGSEPHKASVIGDTIGDPLKDTSGPSLNILIKLMAIISVVFGPSFQAQGLLEKWFS